MFVHVLYHHDGGIHHRADGDGDAAQRHHIGRHALRLHDDEGDQYPQRQSHHGNQRGTQVSEKQQTHQGHRKRLLQQLAFQCVHDTEDQAGAVVCHHELYAFGQTGTNFLQALLDRIHGLQRVLVVAHHHDPANSFAHPVQIGHAPARLRAGSNMCHILQTHRHTLRVNGNRNVPNIV